MDFKKRFDYSDINNFLPDNKTIGTIEYYREKTFNRLPEEEYILLEAKAREEYCEDDVKEIYKQVNQYKKSLQEQVLYEFKERENPDFNKLNVSDYELEMELLFTSTKEKLSNIKIVNDI